MWLLWSDEIEVRIRETNFHFIVAEVKERPNSQLWMLIAVYGDCQDRVNEYIYERITYYVEHSPNPVCAVGDFYAIASIQEKQGIESSGLVDLGHSGPAYTWLNRQRGYKLIMERRLDRRLAAPNWLHLFPNVKVLPNFSSDH